MRELYLLGTSDLYVKVEIDQRFSDVLTGVPLRRFRLQRRQLTPFFKDQL